MKTNPAAGPAAPSLRTFLMLACFLLFACSRAFADDTAVSGVSGNVEMLRGGHPTISMVNEVVKIDDLPDGHVHATFTFKNSGPACDVTIGFPGFAGGDGPGDTGLDNFRSWVDGKSIKVKLIKSSDVSDMERNSWYIKRVHFNNGQTRTIVDDYVGGGGDDSSGHEWFTYVLHTGAAWHGPIGHGEIIVDTSGIDKYAPEISPKEFIRRGALSTWTFSDLKPDEDDDVGIGWFPRCPIITINGKAIPGSGERLSAPPYDGMEATFCQQRAQEIWLPADLAADWLGAKMTMTSRGNYRIAYQGRWVDFRTWSAELVPSTGRKVILPFPVDIESVPRDTYVLSAVKYNCVKFGPGGYHMIGMIGLIRALGGKAHIDKNGVDLVATLPGWKPPYPPIDSHR